MFVVAVTKCSVVLQDLLGHQWSLGYDQIRQIALIGQSAEVAYVAIASANWSASPSMSTINPPGLSP